MNPNPNLSRPMVGAAAMTLAVAFNLPYAVLAATFDYPAILRRPAAEVLAAFAGGGDALVLTWYAFMLSALALVPVALSLALTSRRVASAPALAVGAALCGALAGVLQAVGLARWVFAVPSLARAHADPSTTIAARDAIEQSFMSLNQYGGVAIGEHLGQWLTALFVLLLAWLQQRERRSVTAGIGFATALVIAIGTGEGLAVAMGRGGEAFSMLTIVGYLGLSVWLIMAGVAELRAARHAPANH